ncbi:peptidase S9 [Ahniella affigens]|uniref:Peptidase S9 n=1 Tax=Ahniella affigens TaxID=2021234 RepID=A0A2P1PP19_9GAMM|nr:alpha/beta fold hydrolase [Ahniella affigens]AVP96591.1 peptidase S9 [Ahniella affigens]
MKELLASLALSCCLPVLAQPPELESLFAKSVMTKARLSPSGSHFAALTTIEGRQTLKMLDLETRTPFFVNGPDNAEIADFEWVSDQRLIFTLSDQIGGESGYFPTGEWLAINADGSKQKYLFGFRGEDSAGTHINKGTASMAGADIVDTLEQDDRYVLLQVYPWGSGDAVREIIRVDVRSGARKKIARMPARRARVLVDSNGEPRISFAPNPDGVSTDVYARTADQPDWSPLKLSALAGSVVQPVAMAPDNRRFYATLTTKSGPDAFVLVDPSADKYELLARHDYADPAYVIATRRTKGEPVAIGFEEATPLLAALTDGPEIQVMAALGGAFKGEHARLIDADREGKRYLVEVYSERREGDYFLYDTATKKAQLVGSARASVKPDTLVASQAISLKSRDGLTLRGYLTAAPRGADAPKPPMVVLVHGGPYDIYDQRHYDPEVQALATRGFAVLQVNFRGSGGFGRAFLEAGSKQWGGTMQDDLTDATRWAIEQGHADPKRICIMGGSYGAYAAMMGAAREPELYRCAVGSFGVYDLAMMFEKGDIDDSEFGINYLKNRLGANKEGLRDLSPVYLADQIKADVMLIAGGADTRAPEAHSKAMRKALEAQGKTVTYFSKPTEGHGFGDIGNQIEMMTQVLDFLEQAIGAGGDASGTH